MGAAMSGKVFTATGFKMRRRISQISTAFAVQHTIIVECTGLHRAQLIPPMPLESSTIGLKTPSTQIRINQSLPQVKKIFGLHGEYSMLNTLPL